MVEGNRSTLGDAYWAIRAIHECMDRLDEIDYILFSGAVEELKVRVCSYTLHACAAELPCYIFYVMLCEQLQDAWWGAKEYLWIPVLTLGALLDPHHFAKVGAIPASQRLEAETKLRRLAPTAAAATASQLQLKVS